MPTVMTPAPLYPKEHGSYAIVGVPLASALIIGGVNAVSFLTSIAAIAGFVAHEPLMVALGRRGHRAQCATPHAAIRMTLWFCLAMGSGIAALYLAPHGVRVALALCLLFAGVAFMTSISGRHRSLIAQIFDIMSLTLPSSVVLMAGGVHYSVAVQFWFAWVVGRIATTASVRSAIASQRNANKSSQSRVNDLLLAGSFTCCAIGILAGLTEWLAITPLIGAAFFFRCRPTPRLRMRQLGWILLGVNVVSAALLTYLYLSNGASVGKA